MSSFRFEQHGMVGKLILLGDAASEPGADYPSSLRAGVRQAYESDIRVLHVTSASGSFAIADNPGDIGGKGSNSWKRSPPMFWLRCARLRNCRYRRLPL